MTLINCILCIWLAWCVTNLVLMTIVKPTTASAGPFRIYVPDDLKNLLTTEEIEAIYFHERGHRHHMHVWKNYVMMCFFIIPSKFRRQQQEIEADDYAAYICGHHVLATALRKLSQHPFDQFRANRLERMANGA